MMQDLPRIMGCPCYPITESNIEETLIAQVNSPEFGYAVAINAEKIYRFRQLPELRETVENASFPYPDGAGAVIALRTMYGERSEKINMPIRALETANKHGLNVFIAGAKQDTHDEAVAVIKARYPNIHIVGHLHGYHSEDELIEAIAKAQPQLVMLALGSPKQEHFAAKLKNVLPSGFAVGCGGALDILAGKLKRAPEFWINNHLEWFYRLQQEPWRWRRQLFLPVFFVKLALTIVKCKLTGKQ